jgi:hypothetical protein
MTHVLLEVPVAYFPDLSPCAYFGIETADKLVAIGWLDEEHAIPQGDVNEHFLEKLFDLLVRPWAPSYFMGYADCPWCGEDYDAIYKGKSVAVGAMNLFVPGEGFLYVMPSLAVHHILSHHYAPPVQFFEAVLQCPPMRSRAYFEAIVANAPERYAEAARKQLVANT